MQTGGHTGRRARWGVIAIWLLIFAVGCQAPAPVGEAASPAPITSEVASDVAPDTVSNGAPDVQPTTNLTTGCVDTYRPGVDYFPDKVTLTHSEAWTIEYFDTYKVVTVLTPWLGADQRFQYVLVQCGTPAPEGYPDATLVQVPIRSLITTSSTQLPLLDKLDRLDVLVGHSEFNYVNTPAVRAKIDAGEMVAIGEGAAVNVELAIAAAPDLIMAFSSGDPAYDSHPKLMEAGLTVAFSAVHMEATPLGRVEWVKYMAAFLNEEAQATATFDEIAERYQAMRELTLPLATRPTVFAGIARNGTWSMPGGGHYLARFVEDAGGIYLWADEPSSGSVPLDFEAVYARAADADFWINTSSWQSLADALAVDPRFADFAAFQAARIYNNNARLNEQGGNDYWEGGLANPDVVLADLVKILHPDLLPDHQLVYYRHLE